MNPGRRHRVAGWLNRRLLVRHGWAIWFSQEQRLPDSYSPDATGPHTLVPAGPIRMRLGRYPRELSESTKPPGG